MQRVTRLLLINVPDDWQAKACQIARRYRDEHDTSAVAPGRYNCVLYAIDERRVTFAVWHSRTGQITVSFSQQKD